MVDDDRPSYAGTFGGEAYSRNWLAGAFTVAIDPDAFGDAARYRAMVAGSLAALRELPAAEGFPEVLVAGDVERRNRERRLTGIPVPERTWEEIADVARRYGVAVG
jgi:LDH2 family malate/lactate/ureidoglycolate dehydrogenase